MKIKVIEHLASALTARGLTDVHINFDAKQKRSFFVPIVGPGIKGIFDALQGKTKETLLLPENKITAGIDPEWFNSSRVETCASGKFTLVVDPLQRKICYSISER
ncbi:hypothetical protein KA013_03625 [Patescibacteria group bacterium]|nr:hypothetical protein [Patescibacteria group bacterium]